MHNNQNLSKLKSLSESFEQIQETNELLDMEFINAFYLDWILQKYQFCNSCQYGNPEAQEISYQELINMQSTIILTFSETNCPACIDMELLRLVEAKRNYPEKRFIVLATFSNPRSLIAFVMSKKIELPIFTTLQENNQLPSDLIGRPVYCIVNSTGEVIQKFFPIKELPSLNDKFLMEAINIISNSN